MNNKREIILPFQGFYYSIHDQCLENAVDLLFETEGLKQHGQDSINWRAVYCKFAEVFTQTLSDLINVKLEFKQLLSPKFYNYMTDRILALIDSDTILKLFSEVDRQVLAKRIKDQFTACDGFIPHYGNNLNEWLKKPVLDWDHNELATLLCAWIDSKTDYLADEIDWNVLDRMDDKPYNIISNAVPSRLYNIDYYLSIRANRNI